MQVKSLYNYNVMHQPVTKLRASFVVFRKDWSWDADSREYLSL